MENEMTMRMEMDIEMTMEMEMEVTMEMEMELTKNVGKKAPQKIPKKRFSYSQEYEKPKMRGKKARNNFSGNTRMMRTKKCCEKNRSEKLRKKVFCMPRIW